MEQAATELLRQLIRFDTVNPPGQERACNEHLAALLRDAGFDDVQLLGRTPERPNLVARLKGRAEGPVLGLLSHVDTVLATPEEWQRGPWSGDLVDGVVWGRGAQDMKSQTAAEVAAAVELAGSGWRPARGDLLVLSVVDEETGGGEGAKWLCEHHPDLVRCDYLLNEGGGTVMPFDGTRVHGVCVAEKGVFRFRVTTRGVAGHASMPRLSDSALPKLARIVQALAERTPSPDPTEAPEVLLRELGLSFEELAEREPALAAFVEPMRSVTFAPTIIAASEKINVIPSSASLKVDCRVPPGLGEDVARRRIAEVLDGVDEEYEVEFIERVVGNSSPVETPLMDALRGWIAREDPEARIVPTMLPAFTDSRTWRDAFPECVAYGFFPQRQMTLSEMWTLVHGKDERIHAADVGWAARCYHDVAKELLGDG
jgi:acetylornithine deacetylase/succinyl-diaminopimelate desuccinylase-like protein